MNDSDQIKINTIKTEENKETQSIPRTKPRGSYISISKNQTKKMVVKRKKPNKKTFSDYIYFFLRFINNIPKFFADFLSTGGKSIYYAIIGTMISFIFAILLFPEQPGIFAVFFTTLFIAPFILNEMKLNALLIGRIKKVEKNGISLFNIKVKEEDKFNISDFFEENKKLLSVYFFFFIGVMLVVTTLMVFLPIEYSANLFTNQGWVESFIPSREIGFEGMNKLSVFKDVLINNFSVIIVCFLVALVFPVGAALLIVWNAIYWAVSFTQYSLFYSNIYGVGLAYILLPLFLSVGLHTLLEAIAYFFGTMSGNLLSLGIKKDPVSSDRFYYIFKYCINLLIFALIFLIIGSIVEVFVFDFLKNIFFGLF